MCEVAPVGFRRGHDTTGQRHALRTIARPGLVVCWSTTTAQCTAHELVAARLTIGRDSSNDLSFPEDAYLSRTHGTIAYLAGGWIVEAHKTAFLDGVPFEGRRSLEHPAILRFGRTILLLTRDITPFHPPTAIVDGYVQSATLREAFTDAARAAVDGRTLLILAPTGAGKEAVARAFHERGPRANGPFVVVDSPSVRGDTAVSRLFFSGALGLIHSAAGSRSTRVATTAPVPAPPAPAPVV